MDFQIGVEINNNRIIWILRSSHQEKNQVRLTTVADNQNHAVIKIYIKTGKKKHLLHTENITSIPKQPAGEPSIITAVSISGKNLLYNFNLNGRPAGSGNIKIGRYTHSYRALLTAAVIIIFCAVIASLFYLIPESKPQIPATGKTITKPTHKETETTMIEEPAPLPPEPLPPAPVQTETTTLPVEPVFIESEITDRHSVYFEPDSSKLTADAIIQLGNFIKKLPEEKDFNEATFAVEVRGHCARYGTEEGRAELSRERAVTVYNALRTEWKLEADSVISGAGASEPVTLKRDEQYLNRRVDINIKGNIKKINTSD